MPMEHKAYAFDWQGFDADLRQLFVDALVAGDPHELAAYVDRHRAELTNPYEGESLPADWRDGLENRDVHEFGDYALTRFYDPTDSRGIGYGWPRLSEELPPPAAAALLGLQLGRRGQWFDPGRYGSYFQPPGLVQESRAVLAPLGIPELRPFVALLELCVADGRGVYVTF